VGVTLTQGNANDCNKIASSTDDLCASKFQSSRRPFGSKGKPVTFLKVCGKPFTIIHTVSSIRKIKRPKGYNTKWSQTIRFCRSLTNNYWIWSDFSMACTGTNQPSAVSDRLQTKAAEAPRVLYYNCTRRYFSFYNAADLSTWREELASAGLPVQGTCLNKSTTAQVNGRLPIGQALMHARHNGWSNWQWLHESDSCSFN